MKITVDINTSAQEIVREKLGTTPARFKNLREAECVLLTVRLMSNVGKATK